MDVEPRDRRPTQDIPVQEKPHEGNGDLRECRPAAEQPHGRGPTPPARGPTRDNNRRANEGANVNANTDADAPPLFRRASQNLATAAMLLHGCPEAATSEERRVRQQLKALLKAAAAQQTESSASHQRSERGRAGAPSAHDPNPPTSQHRERGEGGGAATSAVRAASSPTATCGTPSRPDDGPRVSTTTAKIARATTMIVDAGDTTTATTTATATGRQTKGVHGPLVRASATRSSLLAFVL
jgi:hypothetical protein